MKPDKMDSRASKMERKTDSARIVLDFERNTANFTTKLGSDESVISNNRNRGTDHVPSLKIGPTEQLHDLNGTEKDPEADSGMASLNSYEYGFEQHNEGEIFRW